MLHPPRPLSAKSVRWKVLRCIVSTNETESQRQAQGQSWTTRARFFSVGVRSDGVRPVNLGQGLSPKTVTGFGRVWNFRVQASEKEVLVAPHNIDCDAMAVWNFHLRDLDRAEINTFGVFM